MNYLLALNCGSSSIKATLFETPALRPVQSIKASSVGTDKATLKVGDESRSVKGESHQDIVADVRPCAAAAADQTDPRQPLRRTERGHHRDASDRPRRRTYEACRRHSRPPRSARRSRQALSLCAVRAACWASLKTPDCTITTPCSACAPCSSSCRKPRTSAASTRSSTRRSRQRRTPTRSRNGRRPRRVRRRFRYGATAFTGCRTRRSCTVCVAGHRID